MNQERILSILHDAARNHLEDSSELLELTGIGFYKHELITTESTYEENGQYDLIIGIIEDGKTELWKIPGWQTSHAGSHLEWDNIFRVRQVPRIINDYEAYY